jgi:sporulation protein YlmC with PRC-barrel domain
MRISDEALRGRTIIAADGQAIGEVVGVMLESEGWRVDSVHVALHKDVADRLGAGRRMFRSGRVEIPTRMVQSVGDTVVLAVPVDALRQVVAGAADEEHAAPH